MWCQGVWGNGVGVHERVELPPGIYFLPLVITEKPPCLSQQLSPVYLQISAQNIPHPSTCVHVCACVCQFLFWGVSHICANNKMAYRTASSKFCWYPVTSHSHWRGLGQLSTGLNQHNTINSMRTCFAFHIAGRTFIVGTLRPCLHRNRHHPFNFHVSRQHRIV